IDYLRGAQTRQTEHLDNMLGIDPIGIGDLILAEVLQGIDADKDFRKVLRLLSNLDLVELGGFDVAVQAARNFRTLRKKGITVRKTIDCIIATRCIMDNIILLHNDKDFHPFVEYFGLKTVL